jgi:hypothetical protein
LFKDEIVWPQSDKTYKEGKMKNRQVFRIALLALVVGLFFTSHSAAVPWQAKIQAEGQDLGGVKLYEVTIGVDAAASALDAPPAPPSFSVKAEVYSLAFDGPYSKDVRLEGETSYVWVLAVNPHGNINPPTARSSTLSWNPAEFGVGTYEMREGFDGNGSVVVADMKTTTSLEVNGTNTDIFYTIHFTPIIDNTKPVISLIGDATVNQEAGLAFTDPGATASDDIDGDITTDIVTTGTVDTDTIGSYTLTYNVSDASGNAADPVQRTVDVQDTVAPVITRIGEAEVTLEVGDVYNDDGATANDSFDGDLTANIATVNPVDTDTVGQYTVTYDVSDASTNAADQVTRTVNVVDTTKPVLSLTGAASIVVPLGDSFTDPGATATDNYDDDNTLTQAIVVTGGPVDTAALGTYTLTYNVSDSSNNAADPVTRTVEVKDLPSTTFSFSPTPESVQGNYYDNVTVTLTLNSSGNTIYYAKQEDVAEPDPKANGSSAPSGTVDIPLNAVADREILYVVTYFAEDGNGLQGPLQTLNVFIDTVKPVAAITAPAADAYANSTALTISGTDSDGNSIVGVEVSIDGGTTWNDATLTNSWTYAATLALGANAIQARATDTAGNTSVAVVGPTITYYPPLALAIDGQDVTGGEVFVPNSTGSNEKIIVVTGGSGADNALNFATYDWTLASGADGTDGVLSAGASDDQRLFTATVGETGDETLTVQDPKDPSKFSATVTLKVVNFGIQGNNGILTNTEATFTALGNIGNVVWTVEDDNAGAGTPAASGTNNTIAAVTPTGTGTFTLKATDEGSGASAQQAITVVGPVSVTPAKTVVEEDGTLAFTISGGDGNGDPANYTLTVDPDTAGTIDSTTAIFTPGPGDGVRTFTVKAVDKTFSDIEGVSSSVTLVDPITVSVTPNVTAIDSGGNADFTAEGATGAFEWDADFGIISSDGAFTAPNVTTGSQVVTITAYDATYNSSHPTPVKEEFTITVFPVIELGNLPQGYEDGKPETYPVLFSGKTTLFKAADDSRTYDWSVADWTGADVPGATASGATEFSVDPDALFDASGAGVYTVTIKDNANTNLMATFNVRVGMKISPVELNTNSVGGPINFTVSGGPTTGNVFDWAAMEEDGTAVTADNAGAFADTGTTDNTNAFNIAGDLPAPIAFRVKASLDEAQADSNDDVKRLIEAGLDTVMTGFIRIAPVVTYSGTVADDGGALLDGVTVTALHDQSVDTTVGGAFSIGPFDNVGVAFTFAFAKAGYVGKVLTGDEILSKADAAENIVLEIIGAQGGSLTGDVDLSDVGTGNAPKTFVKVKADGDYITDDAGTPIQAITGANGNFSFPILPDYANAAVYTVEAQKSGYITGSLDVLNNDPVTWPTDLPAGGVITLDPVTKITSSCVAGADTTGDSVPDSVECAITAEAGSVPNRFDGTAAEAMVTMADGTPVTISYDGGTNAWTFSHPTYENIQFTVDADVSETPRDVASGYKATRKAEYVKSATAPTTTPVANPNLNGGSGSSGSGNTNANLPPGGLGGDIRDQVVIAIVEANAAAAGATRVTGSDIVEISLLDESGEDVPNADLNRLEITISFDPSVVPEGALENGRFVIYQADSLADMVAGNFTELSPSQIIPPVDYTGLVTFWVDHLSSFGVGAASSGGPVPSPGGGGGGSGCFIMTTTGNTLPSTAPIGVAMAVALALVALLIRRVR